MLNGWDVPFILLLVALACVLYGRYELQREDGSPALALSAYMAAVVLSIVVFSYDVMLPITVIMRHTDMDVWHFIMLTSYLLTALVLTVFGWLGLKLSVDSL